MSSATGSITTKKIYPLTSIRFFLAFQVVVRHTIGTFLPEAEAAASSKTVFGFFWQHIVASTFAVSFFFLISGYVLSLGYLGDKVEKRRFYAARFARIYPLYVVTLLWDTPNLLAQRVARVGWTMAFGKTTATFAVHLAMLQAWNPMRLMGIDDPNWSLSAEAFFYLCFPILGVWLWRLSGASLWIVAGGLYVGGQALVWIVQPHLKLETVMFLPILHLSTFALGIVLAKWQALQRDRGPVRAWHANAVLGISVAALLLVSPLPRWYARYDFCFNGLLAPILMGVIWSLSTARTWVYQVLSARWLVVLGESSYALYLIHIPMFHVFKHLHLIGHSGAYPVFLTLCVCLSILSFYYLETPSRRWLLDWFRMRISKSADPASIGTAS